MAAPENEDPLFLARYPSLPAARAYVQSLGFALGDLLKDAAYERTRRRAVQRAMGCLERDGIPDMSLATETDANHELLSYPLARALVASVGDSYLQNRYAVAESKLLSSRLVSESDDRAWHVATQLGLALETDEAGFAQLPFLDFLRSAPARDPSWKLVNQPLSEGYVSLTKDRAVRLVEEVQKDRLLGELDELERPGKAFDEAFRVSLNQLRTVVAAHREKFASDAGGPLRPEAFPPCIAAIWKGIQGYVNIPHMGRFAIVSFLHTLGMNSDDILRFFSSVPDFDVNKSRYQIEHITGRIGATQYTPPSCSTMQTYGICPLEQRDDICLNLIHHPLSYYRKKVRLLGPPKPNGSTPKPQEVKDAATPGGPQPQ